MKNFWITLTIGGLLFIFVVGGIIAFRPTLSTPSTAATSERHLASDFAAMIPEKITGKCLRWTDDSVLCKMSDTALLWCVVPKEGKPHCEIAVDWTPKPPDQQPPATVQDAPPKTTSPKGPAKR